MGIEEKVSGAIGRTAKNLGSQRDKIIDYLADGKLKDYFEGKSPEQRETLRKSLEYHVDESLEKYRKELHALARKTGTRGAMLGAFGNDVLALLSVVSMGGALAVRLGLFGIKSILEAPAVYRTWKKSERSDVKYGGDLAKYFLIKPVAYMVPFLGPIIEAGSLERMAESRVKKESIARFIKEWGDYKTPYERFEYATKQPLGKVIKFEETVPYGTEREEVRELKKAA